MDTQEPLNYYVSHKPSRFYSVLDRIHPFSLGDKWASNRIHQPQNSFDRLCPNALPFPRSIAPAAYAKNVPPAHFLHAAGSQVQYVTPQTCKRQRSAFGRRNLCMRAKRVAVLSQQPRKFECSWFLLNLLFEYAILNLSIVG